MDGLSRQKLINAGFILYRTRDTYPVSGGGPVVLEIREMSMSGNWVVCGRYPTKAARKRAWDTLMQDPKAINDDGDGGDL